MHKISLFLLFFIFSAISASAQRTSELGLSVGGSYYLGELNPGTPFVDTHPAIGIFYRKNLNTRLALQFHGLRGFLNGNGENSNLLQDRLLNFNTYITEIGAQFEVNFFDFAIGSPKDKISPYLFGGFGVFWFEPKGVFHDKSQLLRPQHTEGQTPTKEYKQTQLSLPFGLGLKYSLGRYVGIGLEWGMRKTTTDYIDDISGMFPQTSGDPPINDPYAGLQRGNSQNKDWYSFALVNISYKFRFLQKENCLDNSKYVSQKRKAARN